MKDIPKLQNLQALRALAALLVVFFHLMFIEGKYGHNQHILFGISNVGAAGVDIFFVISGFILTTISLGRFQTSHYIKSFYLKRFARIYPLYWLYSALVLVVFLIRPAMVNSATGSQVDLFRSFLLLPQHELPLLAVGWTLVHEVYFYVVFCLLLFLPQKRLPIALLGWGVVTVLLNIFAADLNQSSAFVGLLASPLTIEFIAGCFLAVLVSRKQFICPAIFFTFGWLGLFGGYALFAWSTAVIVPTGWMGLLVFGAPAACIVYGAVALEHTGAYVSRRVLPLLGDASYSIYLSHVLVLSVIGRVWQVYYFGGMLANVVWLLVMLLAVIAWGIVSYRLIEKGLLGQPRKRWQPIPLEESLPFEQAGKDNEQTRLR